MDGLSGGELSPQSTPQRTGASARHRCAVVFLSEDATTPSEVTREGVAHFGLRGAQRGLYTAILLEFEGGAGGLRDGQSRKIEVTSTRRFLPFLQSPGQGRFSMSLSSSGYAKAGSCRLDPRARRRERQANSHERSGCPGDRVPSSNTLVREA